MLINVNKFVRIVFCYLEFGILIIFIKFANTLFFVIIIFFLSENIIFM